MDSASMTSRLNKLATSTFSQDTSLSPCRLSTQPLKEELPMKCLKPNVPSVPVVCLYSREGGLQLVNQWVHADARRPHTCAKWYVCLPAVLVSNLDRLLSHT